MRRNRSIAPFSSSEREVRILDAVVNPTSSFLPIERANLLQGRAVGPELVGHDCHWLSVLAHRFPEEFKRCFLVTRLVTKLSSTSPS
jgi:hypothetical protein